MQFLIHLLRVSSGFHFYTYAFRSLHGVLYALPIVRDTSSKNAQVSSATSFRWRHTNASKNHGYNPVADDSGEVSSDTTSFPWLDTNTCKNHWYNAVADDSGQVSSATTWRHTNTRKNHGYNAVAEVSCAGNHVVPRILYSLPTKKVKKVEKSQTFSDHTYPTVSSRRRGRCVQSLVQIGSEIWICIRYKQTNKHEQKTISAKMRQHFAQQVRFRSTDSNLSEPWHNTQTSIQFHVCFMSNER